MSNSLGKIFTLTAFGESHGEAIGGIIDGCPAGIELNFEAIQNEMNRRKPGQSKIVTQRKEPDEVQFLSGIFEGKTTGASIGFIINNVHQRSNDYSHIKDSYRPSHADYTYHQKYGERDYRGGGRSSARETAMRVAAGGIAKKYLKERLGIEIFGYVSQLGPIVPENFDQAEIENNPFFFPDAGKVAELETYMQALSKEGDSIGAKVTVVAKNMPVG